MPPPTAILSPPLPLPQARPTPIPKTPPPRPSLPNPPALAFVLLRSPFVPLRSPFDPLRLAITPSAWPSPPRLRTCRARAGQCHLVSRYPAAGGTLPRPEKLRAFSLLLYEHLSLLSLLTRLPFHCSTLPRLPPPSLPSHPCLPSPSVFLSPTTSPLHCTK